LPAEHVPTLSEKGVHIKLYSGSLSNLTSPVNNYVPFIVADIKIDPLTSGLLLVPANFNTFLYVLEGDVEIGEERKLLQTNQVGWLNILGNDDISELTLHAGENGVRFVLYSGKPLGENIISHGPFIADSSEDIKRLYHEFRQGKMKHISEVPESQNINF